LFSLEKTEYFVNREIMNQGDILNYMNIYTSVKPSKYDIKDIFVKNNIEYKPYFFNGKTKKGVELFTKSIIENQNDVPF
jgi:hypothetical protein